MDSRFAASCRMPSLSSEPWTWCSERSTVRERQKEKGRSGELLVISQLEIVCTMWTEKITMILTLCSFGSAFLVPRWSWLGELLRPSPRCKRLVGSGAQRAKTYQLLQSIPMELLKLLDNKQCSSLMGPLVLADNDDKIGKTMEAAVLMGRASFLWKRTRMAHKNGYVSNMVSLSTFSTPCDPSTSWFPDSYS